MVGWAQQQAQVAIDAYRRAQDASRRAADAYDAKVTAYNQAADRYNATAEAGGDPGAKPTNPGDFVDPGTAGREEAQEILSHARRLRTDAAQDARRKLAAALESAPPKPEFTDRLGAGAADLFVGTQLNSVHVLGGLLRGGTDALKLARTVNPLDPYNLTHPGEWTKNSQLLLAGLVGTAAHPERLPMSLLGTGWSSDPGDSAGYLLSNLIGGKGAGGVGRAALKDGLRGLVARDAAKGAAREGVRQGGLGATARKLWCKVFGSDPIDMATGRMSLPQTDVSLPARLPLMFSRQFESSYRAGRWFGPKWTSTADQRLEIDAEGVIFVREDGSLLAYPHPAPGVPTLPLAGEGHPMTVDEYGDYTVTDPADGRVWDFAGPGGDGNGIALLSQIIDRSGQWLTLDALPKTAQPAAKRAIQEIYNAEDKERAVRAVRDFQRAYQTKYPKVVKRITHDEAELLAFFDFPAEHWIHLRTTNPIESTFATVRLRTKVTKGAGSRAAGLAMVCKLIESAQARWRAVNAPHLVALVRAGARFERGHLVERPESLAA
ncbi:RHS/YD repeat-containing protein [Streptomyces sviceus ATCC 29083]|uniref:RHS/YD repeat-containing protein n=1 Tax=Streptomyces sviceus (strain ATCC 29083 / DSM 924 / JCM 4929 / NBRC 13980 / NCIMB 11184 / NRRL 5439 / UC 5370) TaxID=463191 RepID=D6XAM8_STRX2|nr:RHS/YD repeat-containing protein [Streptomyces sviceus ATCC 29083]